MTDESKKQKLSIIYFTSSSTKSGGARQALYTAMELGHMGHDVVFFVPEDSDLPPVQPDFNWKTLPPKNSEWMKAVEAALPDHPCIVHAFHNKALKKASLWGLFRGDRKFGLLANRGVIFRPHNPLPYWSPGIDLFTVNSEACAKILRQFGVGKNRIKVIHNGLAAERIRISATAGETRGRLGISEDTLVFGSLTNDSPYKGVDKLLKAYAAARPKNSKLLLLGLRPELWRTMIEELKLADDVIVMPYIDNVGDYLQVFGVFVLPSLMESMPNTLLEALAFGLPVLASKVGAVPDIARNNGILFPPGDVDKMAEAIYFAAENPEKREAWREQSFILAENFSIRNKAARVEAVYFDLLKSKGLI